MRQTMIVRMHDAVHAGGKARADVAEVSRRLGLAEVRLDNGGSRPRRALRSLVEAPRVARTVVPMGAGDALLAQFPLGYVADRVVERLGGPLKIALVHDVEGLRQGISWESDLRLLDGYDVIIAPGRRMRAWLEAELPGDPRMVTLPMWDYLVPGDPAPPEPATRPDRLYLVGNLRADKTAYLRSLGPLAVPVHAFGPNCDPHDLPSHVTWGGLIDTDRPALPAADGFGLVWDGHSATGLTGDSGRYMALNLPHKLSFYLAAGVPVVVSDDAAIADLVVERGIGLRVPSVYDAAEAVAACTPEEWQRLCAHVAALREELLAGAHVRRALEAALGPAA